MKRFTTIAIATICLLLAGCANSQSNTPTTEVEGPIVSESQPGQDREFTDEEIEGFAAAYNRVTSIQQEYQTQIAEAEGAERERLQTESRQKTEEVMNEAGVTPETYNAIAIQMSDDPELRERVQQALQKRNEERVEETQQQMENP